MVGDEPGVVPDQKDARESEDELLLQAVSVLRLRYEQGGGYPGLPPSAASELRNTLTGIVEAPDGVDDTDRVEAIALAHRLLDNDHPEQSPLWPHSAQ